MPSGFTWKYAGSVRITSPRLRSMPSRSAAVSPKVRAKRRKRRLSRSWLRVESSGRRGEPAVEDEDELVLLARASSSAEKVR